MTRPPDGPPPTTEGRRSDFARLARQLFVILVALLTATAPAAGAAAFGGAAPTSATAPAPTDDAAAATPAAAQPADVLHQANAGGAFTASDGSQWSALIDYMVAGEDETSSHGQPGTVHSSVPAGTPSQIWNTERWDPGGGEEMQYEFPVPAGQQVEVRLFFYDGYSGTSQPGDRVFDVSVEGDTVLDGFDIVDEYGDDTAAMESVTVTSDGTVDVDFGHVTENPQINAIQIVAQDPQPNSLGAPTDLAFGDVLAGESATESVTVTNLGGSGDPTIDLTDVSVTGSDAGAFSAGSPSQTELAPGESATIPVTFAPADAQSKAATLELAHSGSNSPTTVSLSGSGASSVDPDFSKSTLQGFSAGNPTALEFGPDDRLYVATQSGTVYALTVERTGEDAYQVTSETAIDAVNTIPNHDDQGDYVPGEETRQVTGLTVAGTASNPVLYVSSSDPTIDVGEDDDDTDTNSGAVSRLELAWNGDTLAGLDHDVLVLGLPRSEENHSPNGLDLSADGDTLYLAQGGHTNKGAPSSNFGHTPEYALSAAILEIDLAQIEANYQPKNLADYDPQGSSADYPALDFYYAIPTIQSADGTPGDDLPFGGNDGANQAKLVAGGPVQIYSPGYRNPYDLVVAEGGQLYAADHGPNGGWGGQPADAGGDTTADAASVTNHPNEAGSYSTSDQLVKVDEGDYGGHPAPIRANPTQADIYAADGTVKFDVTEANSPVPPSLVDSRQADYIPPTPSSPDPGAPAGSANTMETTDGDPVLFGPTGAIDEYTASNFGGAMAGDLLVVELGGSIERVQLGADGETVTEAAAIFNTGGPLGLDTVGDGGPFPGTVWTANHGGNDVTVFEPVDYGDAPTGPDCTGADDPTLDEDGDGYDNADELDAGTDPCSAASTPPDFDDDGTSNVNDPDDDNDGLPDTSDPFAVDPANGLDTTLPVEFDLSELSLFGENGQGWTGLMTNGNTDYQSHYDPSQLTVGGAAEVLTVEDVPTGDATNNDQQYAFQFGVAPPDEPFTVNTTVNGYPENPTNFQSLGIYVGTGDQDNYAKLVVAANGGTGGLEFAKEVDGSFSGIAQPDAPAVTGPGTNTDLSLTVDPTTDPNPDNGVAEVAVSAAYAVDGGEYVDAGSGAIPASWLDTSDGTGLAVGIISTSYSAGSTFDATWTDLSVDTVSGSDEPADPTPGDVVWAVNAGGDQYTSDEGVTYAADANYTGGNTFSTEQSGAADDPDIGFTDDDPLYHTERYGDPFGYDVPLSNGTYEVTLRFAEIYQGVAPSDTPDSSGPDDGTNENDRLFSASVEGEQVLSEFDLFAQVGPLNATQETVVAEVTDGQLDVDFAATNDNAKLSAMVVRAVESNSPPTISPVGDQTATVGETATTAVSATDPDGDAVALSLDGAPGFVSLADASNGSATLTMTPASGDSGTYQFDVVASDGEATATEPVTLTVQQAAQPFGVATSPPTDVAADGATLQGDLLGVGDHDNATVYFQYWQPGAKAATLSWWTGTPQQAAGNFTASVPLQPDTAYSVQAYAQASDGTWTAGAVETFTTPAGGGFAATTGTAADVTPQSATLNGTVSPGSAEDATPYVRFWVQGQPNQTYWYTGSPVTESGEVSFPVDLSPSTTYEWQVLAQASDGRWTTGDVATLTTPTGEFFGVETGNATGVGVTSATLGGDLVNLGDNDNATVYVTYWEQGAKAETLTWWTGSPQSSPGEFAADVGGLASNTTYEYRAFAQSDEGEWKAGAIETVTTQDGEPFDVATEAPTDVSADGATLTGNLTGLASHDSATVYFQYWQPGAKASTLSWWTGSPQQAAGEFTASVLLDPGTEYSVQAYAQASDGTWKAGAVETFETPGDGGQPPTDPPETDPASSVLTVTPNSGVGASTYSSGSFTLTNTGEQALTSVTIDLSTTALPDVVFDPAGTAGDSAAKGLTIDGQTGDGVGVVSTATDDVFAQPHNGANASDGYDVLTIEFTDFEPGESVSFSADNDPTSIKGATVPSQSAGPISGLELSRATVTATYGAGATQTTQLAGDGSGGGAEAVLNGSVPEAPTLGVQGVTLDSGALDGQHAAATVADAAQTFTVSGPAGATVEVVHVSAALELSNVPDYGGTPGHAVEPYEANDVETVDYQTVALGGDGEATVPVTLVDDGNFDYVTARVTGGDATGLASDVVVLKHDPSDGGGGDDSASDVAFRVNAGGSTIAATDDGPDWTGVPADAAASPYLASLGDDAGSYCGGDEMTAGSDVPDSTPGGVYDCELYGESQWSFPTEDGQQVEVRLYVGNQFPGTSEPGQRQFNASIEGEQVLTNYDPVADVGHATGTVLTFTVTTDGALDVTLSPGAVENPQVNAIEVVNATSAAALAPPEVGE